MRGDRNQGVRATARGRAAGGAMPSTVGARGSAAPRAKCAANGKGRGQASVLKWRTEEVGRASVDSDACSPFPFRRPVYGSPRRCPRKPHESLHSVQALPAVAAAHLHGHCYYRRPPQSAVTCRFCALCGGLCRHSHRRPVARRRRRDRRETRKKCGFKNRKEKNNKKVLTNHYK